jgi:hypothetical protein
VIERNDFKPSNSILNSEMDLTPDTVLWIMDTVQREVEAESLFEHPENLLQYAESLIRTTRPGVINNPLHICQARVCEMEKESIMVYRRPRALTTHIQPQTCHHTTSQERGTGMEMVLVSGQARRKWHGETTAVEDFVRMTIETAETTRLHVCVADLCVHLKPGHRCEDPINCPHGIVYHRHDTKELLHVFSCKHSGNLHMCGPRCKQKMTTNPNNGMHVCPLTGIVLGSQLAHVQETYSNSNPHSHSQSQPRLLPLLGYGGTRMTRQDCEQLACKMMDDLIFSPTRQHLEWTGIQREFLTPLAVAVTAMKKKRYMSSFRDCGRIMEIMYLKKPKSTYFNRFGANNAILARVSGDAPRQMMDNNRRIASLLSESPEYCQVAPVEHETIRRVIGRAVVYVYNQLVEYCGSDAKLLTDLGSFRSAYLNILYMMQTGYSVPVPKTGLNNMVNSASVCVIPRFDMLGALPAQRDIVLYVNINADVKKSLTKKKQDKNVTGIILERAKRGNVYAMEFPAEMLLE